MPDFTNPQCLNRYSYCLNNPLKYTDPTGHWSWGDLWGSVKNFVSSITSSVTSTVKSGWNSLTSKAKSTYNTYIAPVVNKISDWGQTATNKVITSPMNTPEPPSSSPTPTQPPSMGPSGITNRDGNGDGTEPNLPIEPRNETDVGNDNEEDIAALSFETLETFGHFGVAFATSGVVFGTGFYIIGIGIATSEVGVGIGLVVAGGMLAAGGTAGMLAVGYAAIETWNRLEYGERWERVLGW